MRPQDENGITHIVMYSGGICSFLAAERLANTFGKESLVLLFADTKMEDPDLYRFLDQTTQYLGIPLTRTAEGRTPWEVFEDVKYLGNWQSDPCSRILKRTFLRKFIREHFDPMESKVYLGYDWTEGHRVEGARPFWDPWNVGAPMGEAPYLTKKQMIEETEAKGIELPRLYALGFPHNNCGGFCIKAGISHFVHLYKTLPDVFAYHEERERKFREKLGKNVAILKYRSGPSKGQPMPLAELRQRLELDEAFDEFDWGGCGCG